MPLSINGRPAAPPAPAERKIKNKNKEAPTSDADEDEAATRDEVERQHHLQMAQILLNAQKEEVGGVHYSQRSGARELHADFQTQIDSLAE